MQEETFPDLSCPECLSTTSDYLRVLVSWQACPTHRSWQARPHRCALGFRPSCGYLLPPETTPERKKYHNFMHSNKAMVKPLPLSAPCSVPVHRFYGREYLCERKIFCLIYVTFSLLLSWISLLTLPYLCNFLAFCKMGNMEGKHKLRRSVYLSSVT